MTKPFCAMLVVTLLAFGAAPALADCPPSTLDDTTLRVIEKDAGGWAQRLEVRSAGGDAAADPLYSFEFDRLGGGGCVALFTLPEQGLFGVHWDEGSAGTSLVYTREMLYLWGLEGGVVRVIGDWILREEDGGRVLVDRIYKIDGDKPVFETRSE